jgi:hypothetical protein
MTDPRPTMTAMTPYCTTYAVDPTPHTKHTSTNAPKTAPLQHQPHLALPTDHLDAVADSQPQTARKAQRVTRRADPAKERSDLTSEAAQRPKAAPREHAEKQNARTAEATPQSKPRRTARPDPSRACTAMTPAPTRQPGRAANDPKHPLTAASSQAPKA